MPWKDLGEVVGKNGTIGNVDSTYVNNGGEPGVSVTKSGDDSAPDLTFEFENLVNDPLTSSEIEQISNDTQLTSSSVLNGTGLTTLWSRIKAKFATKSHTHDASDITAGELAATLIANGLITEEMLHDGAVTGDKIANGSITKDKLEKTLGDSLSRLEASIVKHPTLNGINVNCRNNHGVMEYRVAILENGIHLFDGDNNEIMSK